MKARVLAIRAFSSSKVCFRVLELRNLAPGKPRRRALRLIGRDLHLAGKREHVRRELRVDQFRRVDALRLAMRGGLVENAPKASSAAAR